MTALHHTRATGGFPCAMGHVGPFEPVPEWDGWLNESWARCSCGSHVIAAYAAALSAGKDEAALGPDGKWWLRDRTMLAGPFLVGPFDSEGEALAELAAADRRTEVRDAA